MYKNVCHKIIVYVLVGCLSFGVPATTYYKSVHAIEFLGGALAFEEALKWLLAIVGVTAAGSFASQVDWSEVREQCVEVQLHNGASQAQVSEWWAKLARGTVDKASSCWSSFLEWSGTLADSSGSGSILSGSVGHVLNAYLSEKGYNPTISTSQTILNTPCYAAVSWGNYLELLISDGTYIYNSQANPIMNYNNGSTFHYYEINLSSSDIGNPFERTSDGGNFSAAANPQIFWNINVIHSNYNYSFISISGGGSGSVPVESDWKSAIEVARENLNLLNRDLPDENSSEVSIPMPGLADSDDEVSADAYDNIVDSINDGTISLDDGIAQIQDLLHVLVIDDTTDIVQPVRPDPDTGEDQTKEDVIKENKSNMGFTLAGLEKVFPFCIPFDIYAFLTLLVAEPVAPEFDFPVKSVNNQTEEIHIDLSPFEPVAVVVRYIFDFLFIIGLALMTRSLIGGGSSD